MADGRDRQEGQSVAKTPEDFFVGTCKDLQEVGSKHCGWNRLLCGWGCGDLEPLQAEHRCNCEMMS